MKTKDEIIEALDDFKADISDFREGWDKGYLEGSIWALEWVLEEEA